MGVEAIGGWDAASMLAQASTCCDASGFRNLNSPELDAKQDLVPWAHVSTVQSILPTFSLTSSTIWSKSP